VSCGCGADIYRCRSQDQPDTKRKTLVLDSSHKENLKQPICERTKCINHCSFTDMHAILKLHFVSTRPAAAAVVQTLFGVSFFDLFILGDI
jgi:hypothetical protein